jgi:hypothetical protein
MKVLLFTLALLALAGEVTSVVHLAQRALAASFLGLKLL